MPAKRRQLFPAALLFVSLAVQVVGSPAAGAQEAPASTASIDKVGWWNVSRGPQDGEPDNPVRPALAPAPAPPTNVPANAVGVGANLGEPTKVAAVGILLEGADGGTVDQLTLTLKEAPSPGANVGSDQAKLVACPITSFWGETRNGSWIDRPEADCELASASGTRGADGTWTFDLASVAAAAQWLDPAGSTGQNGVLVTEAVDAPAGFEVAFLDTSANGMSLQFAASGGGDAATDPFADTMTASDGAVFGPSDAGVGAAPLDLGRTDPFSISPAPLPSGGAAPGPSAAPGGDTDAGTRAGAAKPAAVSASRAGDLVGNLSWPTLLLLPVALVIALALSRSLGASDTPATAGAVPGRRRLGGVSRALARREHATPVNRNA